MKVLIICSLAIVCSLAEPPVENRYLPPQLNGATGAIATSQQFGAPSQTYGAPNFGNQKQTDAIFRGRQSSRSHSRGPSSQYGAPQRTPSALYGAPSTQYGAPSRQFAAPSSQYGAPSTQYGTPSGQFGASSGQFSAPTTQYGAPSTQYGTPSGQFGAPSGQFSAPSTQYGAPSTQYGTPSGQFGVQSGQLAAPSTQYGAPSGQYRTPSGQFSAQSGQLAAPLTQYSAPGAQAPSALYGTPGVGGSSQQHGFGAAGQFTHGGGSFRGVEQSRQYLPPGSRTAGYDGEDDNREPANYSFEYMVKDEPSGNDFGHREARQGDRAEGLYYVLLPDGRKQTVEYEADQDGYKPRISYEDTGLGPNGYEKNSQAYNEQGPY